MLIYTRHDPRFFDRRLHKGGDGGAGAMRQQEEERQAKVQAAVDAINGKFGYGGGGVAPTREQFTTRSGSLNGLAKIGGGTFDEQAYNKALADYQTQQSGTEANKVARQAMYDDVKGATRDTALRGLDKQYTTASQQNKFGLARSGLLGGSVDAESGADLTTRYGEGRIQAEQAGIGAASDLKALDEKTRQNLISLAQSGIDTGTAASLAAGQMAAAADSARSGAAVANVGDLFGNMSQAYLRQQQALGKASVPSSGYSTTNLYTSSPNLGRTTN